MHQSRRSSARAFASSEPLGAPDNSATISAVVRRRQYCAGIERSTRLHAIAATQQSEGQRTRDTDAGDGPQRGLVALRGVRHTRVRRERDKEPGVTSVPHGALDALVREPAAADQLLDAEVGLQEMGTMKFVC